MIKKESLAVFFGLIGLFVFGLVGTRDFEDELAEQEFYCERVLAGDWPDYQHIADEVCNATDD